MRKRRIPLGALLAGGTLALALSFAYADEPSGQFEKGQAAYQAGRYDEAYGLFLSVFQQKPAFDAAANLGQTAMKLQKKEAAATYLQYALQTLPVSIKPETKDALTKLHAEAKKGLVEVKWKSDPAATFKVDGIEVGKAPLSVTYSKPGVHRFEASVADGRFADKQVQTKEDEVIELDLPMPAKPGGSVAPSASAPPPPPPSASVSASASVEPPPPGEKSGYEKIRLPLAIGVGAGGLVLFITGLGLAGASAGKAGEADQLLSTFQATGGPPFCPTLPDCNRLKKLNEDADAMMNAGVPLIVTGLVLGAAATTLGLLPASLFASSGGAKTGKKNAPIVRWAPTPGGLVVQGTY